ncbi:MAG TPA: hypothetical protein EYP23_02175, partial [Thermoplasmata archaeon]|nr:hypothetical protein [Thermoplasmata archaeon]
MEEYCIKDGCNACDKNTEEFSWYYGNRRGEKINYCDKDNWKHAFCYPNVYGNEHSLEKSLFDRDYACQEEGNKPRQACNIDIYIPSRIKDAEGSLLGSSGKFEGSDYCSDWKHVVEHYIECRGGLRQDEHAYFEIECLPIKDGKPVNPGTEGATETVCDSGFCAPYDFDPGHCMMPSGHITGYHWVGTQQDGECLKPEFDNDGLDNEYCDRYEAGICYIEKPHMLVPEIDHEFTFNYLVITTGGGFLGFETEKYSTGNIIINAKSIVINGYIKTDSKKSAGNITLNATEIEINGIVSAVSGDGCEASYSGGNIKIGVIRNNAVEKAEKVKITGLVVSKGSEGRDE